ncbi:MAG: hypothetical protein M1404_04495 [Acidobacteria bacterium]|nr:hypothetical protein [Acidobacteriota bacterium]
MKPQGKEPSGTSGTHNGIVSRFFLLSAAISKLVPMVDMDAAHVKVSLTTPQWQYIEHRDGRQELYNWTVDPKEQDNLVASLQEQATLERLHSRLVDLVTDATGPWRGPEYLLALGTGNPSQPAALFPKPLQPGNPQNLFRIGMAQAYFQSQPSAPTRPSRSERDLMRSLPYQ